MVNARGTKMSKTCPLPLNKVIVGENALETMFKIYELIETYSNSSPSCESTEKETLNEISRTKY